MSTIGTRMPRTDAEPKVRGETVYTFDLELARMLHAALLRSPVPAGRVTRIDTARAESLPGVEAILTAADCDGRGGWFVKDQQLFAGEQVRFAGEPIAAVAARTLAQARAAVAAIELEIEPFEPVLDLDHAVTPEARLVHPDWESYEVVMPAIRSGNVAWQSELERGDVEAAFATAAVVVEGTYEVPRQVHTPIEPHCAVAQHEAGRFVVHTSTQYPFAVRDRVAEMLGLRKSAVRVITPPVGGAFGGKLDALLEPYCCLLAKRCERPVKLVNSRREQLSAAGSRENARIRIRTAATGDGRLLAHDADFLLDAGAYTGETGVFPSSVGVMLTSSYRIEAVRSRGRAVYTNTFPTMAFRGTCGLYVSFVIERQLDKLAASLEIDRRELRLRNILHEGEQMGNGQVVEDGSLVEAFAAAEELWPWADLSRRHPHRGVGIAALTWLTNTESGAATMKLNEDGTVNLITAAPEVGTGAVAAGLVQIAADALGLAPEDVVVAASDTDTAAYEAGAQGSRTLFNTGEAVRRAGAELREQVVEVAAELLEAAPGDLVLADGEIGVAGSPGSAIALSAVAAAAGRSIGPIQGRGSFRSPAPAFDAGCLRGAVTTTVPNPSYHVHVAEVEVDPDLGKVQVLRYAVVQDVGRAINPAMIEGQVEGSVAQGLGYALLEGTVFEGGHVVNDDLEGYRLPTALDMPPIDLKLLEMPSSHGPFGLKGAGEPAIVPVAAAISNAVSDAIGCPLDRLPITPFDVLSALRADSGQQKEATL
jgi:CO/xanthine dehydrogenase Mo-binding subunit